MLVLLMLAGCSRVAPPEPPEGGRAAAVIRFTDVVEASGITFRYTFGDIHYENILESSGSGLAWFDCDNDGWMDLYALNGRYLEGISDASGLAYADAQNELWRNLGNGTFTNVTVAAGVGGRAWGMAPGIADFDGDGFEDVFLANYGPNQFLRNRGDGTFVDETEARGLAGPETLNGFVKWSVGAAPFDADGDGDLDLLVGNFLAFDPKYQTPGAPGRMPAPGEYAGQPSTFYRRQADGTFREATSEAGLFFPENKVMGLTVFDLDGDGDLDIFQANDHQPNFLFRNRGEGIFGEDGLRSGVAVNLDGVGTGSMHGSLGDVDNDGLIDILVTDLNYGSLYRNLGNGRYEDITESSGLRPLLQGREGWGGGFHDFDNDGDLDLFIANGGAETLVEKGATLLVNDGRGHFTDGAATAGSYFQTQRSGRGVAFGDYDNDGDIDIAVSHVDLQAKLGLLRNDTDSGNHWLGIRLVPTRGATEPAGAEVLVTAGGRTQVRVYQRAQSYLSQNDPRLHFGLGSAREVELVEVRWPGRGQQRLGPLPCDQYAVVREP